MTYHFAEGLPETKFKDLSEALAFMDSHPTQDTVVSASDVTLTTPSEIRLPDGSSLVLTRSAFVQLLHFLHLNWEDVKHLDPREVHRDVRSRLSCRPGQLMFRAKRGVVQAVLSPAYTPLTNADVLRGALGALDLSKVSVTLYRGQLRVTGVSESVTFQPEAGDIISGGWELTNNEFGKGALSVNQFLLRLVCTNGAVIQTGGHADRFVHRGWDWDSLVSHVGEVGAEAIRRMDGLNEALKRMTQTQLGDARLRRLSDAAAAQLGRKGLEEMHSEVSPGSSLYDAYNHLTFVSQRKSLGPRRELEKIAGSLLTNATSPAV